MHLITLPSQKTYVEKLFEKAVNDYLSKSIKISCYIDDIFGNDGNRWLSVRPKCLRMGRRDNLGR